MSKLFKKDVPFSDLVRQFFAEKPKEVDGVANESAAYYRSRLLQKVLARYEFKGLPTYWDKDYFLETLFLYGKICITDTPAGILALKCSTTGIGIFEQPTECIITNPVLGNFRRTIDVDCTLIRLQYNYRGCYDLINRFATMLAMCDSGIAVNLMNSKVAYVFRAASKAQAATMEAMYDQISCGKPATFVGENGALNQENFFTFPVKENYVAGDIQITKRKIINEFLSEIGINNANIDKKERLNSDEVNANNEEININAQHWTDNLKEGVEKANKLFGLNLSVDIRDFSEERSPIDVEPSGTT